MGTSHPDFDTLLKAIHSISRELDMERLLATVMKYALECGGAERGLLFLNNSGRWEQVARAETSAAGLQISLSSDENPTGAISPEAVLFLEQVQARLLSVDSTMAGGAAQRPPWAQAGARSWLCIPFEQDGEPPGRLYLENSRLPDAFPPQTVTFLETMLAQAAIAIANARSYAALQGNAKAYRRILDNAHEGIWMLGSDAITTFVNSRMAEMLGYTAEEMLDQPMQMFIEAAELPDHLEKMEARRQGVCENYERRLRCKDGSTLWVLASATSLVDARGRFQGSFARMTDITDRKQMEERVSLLNFAIDNIEEGVFLLGQDGQFQFVNQEVCRSLGYTRDELLQMGVPDIDPFFTQNVWDQNMDTNKWRQPITAETFHKARDGRIIPVEVYSYPFEHQGHNYRLAFTRNITDRKQSEEALSQLNRKLVAISSCNQALLRAVDETALIREVCRIICEDAGYLLAWVGYAEDDEEKTVRPAAWAGLEQGYLQTANIRWSGSTPYGHGPAGTAIREGVIVCVQDFATDPTFSPWRENALQRGYCSTVALPLKDGEDHSFGMLGIYASAVNAFSLEEIQLLEELAKDLSFGIVNLRAREKLRQAEQDHLDHLRFLESLDLANRALQGATNLEEMMARVLDALLEIFACDRSWLVYPCDPHAETWQVQMEHTRPEYPGGPPTGTDFPVTPEIAEMFQLLRETPGPVPFGPGSDYPISAYAKSTLGVQSMIVMAIYPRLGRPWSFGLHQCAYARIWTPAEVRLFQEIGRRSSDYLTSLLMYRDLQQSEERYRSLFTLMDEGVAINTLVYDEQGEVTDYIVTDVNPAFLKRIDKSLEQIIGRRASELFQITPEYVREWWQGHRNKQGAIHSEYHHEASGRWFIVTTTQPQGTRFATIFTDITERKQAEEAVWKLNQELEQRVLDRTSELNAVNTELEAFAYSVSHDLRAPLRHIDGFMELLHARTASQLDDKSRHYMDIISESVRRMGKLIDDLLAFSRMGRYELTKTPVDMAPLVREVIEELEPERGARNVVWEIGAIPMVTGDRALLKIVLVNLVSNALKFTIPREQARIEIGAILDQESEIILFVRDNGVGFEMTYVDKLFGVFQRLHREDEFEGTGIGLANVRRIIARHHGRTWAEGQVDLGATFYFSLPWSK